MKRIHLLATLCTALFANAQDSSQVKVYKNELGLDATGMLRQFLHFNGSQFPEYYNPVYFISYRRHFGKCNLRAAIGGLYYFEPFESPFTNDPNEYERGSQQFDLRVGFEWTSELSKRWQTFYGLDYKQGFYKDHNDAPFWNGGYANGRDTKIIGYGIAPLLGFRFRLTERISLITEASLTLKLETIESRRYFLSVDPQSFPPQPEVIDPKITRINTSFEQPLSIFFTFDF